MIVRETTAAPRVGDAPARVDVGWVAADARRPRFWESLGTTPVVGPAETLDGQQVRPVTFLAQVPAGHEALVHVNSLTDRHRTDLEPALLERVPGTDVTHVTYLLPDDLVASYRFVVAPSIDRDAGTTRSGWFGIHEAGRPDPRCPEELFHPHGAASSVLRMPAARSHPAWAAARSTTRTGGTAAGPAAPGGRVARQETRVAGRPVVLLGDVAAPHALVLFDGAMWESAGLRTALAHRDGELAVVLVDSGSGQERADLLPHPERVGAFVERVRDRLGATVPALGDPSRVTAAGVSFGGLAAAGLAVTRPDLVGSAVVQSGSFQFRAAEELRRDTDRPGDLLRSLAGRTLRTRLHVQVGAEEDMLAHQARRFVERAREAGADVTFDLWAGGHDFAWWTDALLDGLDRL
ncbi:enterochelin esterase domain-containing protein [Isoptericola aurantiacus]|uniref:enterochelin esterase domain-containing protein n=1 Tax=Isoptericola aurantiacus TaxID=3377839 RepID=UPI00383B248B